MFEIDALWVEWGDDDLRLRGLQVDCMWIVSVLLVQCKCRSHVDYKRIAYGLYVDSG